MIIMGIDPGTGKSSPTGLALIEQQEQLCLLHTQAIRGSFHEIVEQLANFYADKVMLETFVMQGRAGQLLNRLNGAIMFAMRLDEDSLIHTMTVKKRIGGTGKADKAQVAEGVLNFNWDPSSRKRIKALVVGEAWDQTDAIAIALCGL